MAAMAAAAMAEMRQSRTPPPPMSTKGSPPKTSKMAESKGGAAGPGGASGTPPPLAELKKTPWGKLPPKLAADLTKAKNETIPNEYREAVETYYRVIAEKSKKP